jgi:peptidoglycan/xylan/chitin deacetylase (PgdA/CDA1 family)
MRRRLTERDFQRRFVCLTFDDGYRDLMQWAYPVLRKHEVPFALYVPTSFPDRIGELWWLALERVISENNRIGLLIDGREQRFDCVTIAEKRDLFDQLYWWLRARETEGELRDVVRDLCARYGVNMKSFCEDLCMTWDEIADLARDPLVTIGAHTVNHVILKKTSDRVARSELEMGRAVIEAAIGVRPNIWPIPSGTAPRRGSANTVSPRSSASRPRPRPIRAFCFPNMPSN